MDQKAKESSVRRLAQRSGYRVEKSRERQHINNVGQFMLVDGNNVVVLGTNYDASLDEIEEFFRDGRHAAS